MQNSKIIVLIAIFVLLGLAWRYLDQYRPRQMPVAPTVPLVEELLIADLSKNSQHPQTDSLEIQLKRINLLLNENKCLEAVPLLQNLLQKQVHPAFWVALGQCWVLENQGDSALHAFDQAQSLNPSLKLTSWIKKARQLQYEAQNMAHWESPHFSIQVEGQTAMIAEVDSRLLRLERSFDQLSLIWDFYPERKIYAVLYGKEQLLQGTLPDWTGALFDGKVRIPYEALVQHGAGIERILLHEVSHAFNHTLCTGNLPIWLDEGIAQIIDGTELNLTVLEEKLASYEDLQRSFVRQKDVREALRLYQTSLAMTRVLLDDYALGNWQEIRYILAEISKNNDFEQILMERWAISSADLYQQVQKQFSNGRF